MVIILTAGRLITRAFSLTNALTSQYKKDDSQMMRGIQRQFTLCATI
jgi:hypothetical protein